MHLNIKATKLELTEEIRNYFQEKMDKTEKYLGRLQVLNCDVEVAKVAGDQRNGNIFRAEVNLQVPQQILRVERTSSDLFKAIDKVQEHLKLVIKRYKDKLENK